jgi:hypothetical protein
MTLDDFRQSLTATEPPAGLTHVIGVAEEQAKEFLCLSNPASFAFGGTGVRQFAVLPRSFWKHLLEGEAR